MQRRAEKNAFTLIEILVSVTVLGLLVAILLPGLGRARRSAKAAVCSTRLHTLGHGIVLYANEFEDMLVPGRMPKVNDDQWRVGIEGGIKYRPTFLAMMGSQVGVAPFEDPQASKNDVDRFGQVGDRQNYSSEAYLCPSVSDWVDERNGAYGYNYQFLGNSRFRGTEEDPGSFKNWPLRLSQARSPGACVSVADSMGTAAAFSKFGRLAYEDDDPAVEDSGEQPNALGNEGFNLDPPRIDLLNGEIADQTFSKRSAPHERHIGKANVLWLDGHASAETLKSLGYKTDPELGIVQADGNNRFFHFDARDQAWVK